MEASPDDPGILWDRWADSYDDFHGAGDADAIVTFLTTRSPGPRYLDVGVGTGRIAVPLACTSLAVQRWCWSTSRWSAR